MVSPLAAVKTGTERSAAQRMARDSVIRKQEGNARVESLINSAMLTLRD
jgi:hypothetical protein